MTLTHLLHCHNTLKEEKKKKKKMIEKKLEKNKKTKNNGPILRICFLIIHKGIAINLRSWLSFT